MLSHRAHADDPVQATGHGDLVCDEEGNWWIVFLAIRAHGYPAFHTLGRETFLASIRWEDGWPIVDGAVTLESRQANLEPQRARSTLWRADLSGPVLGPEWNFLRAPDPRISVGRDLLLFDSRAQLDAALSTQLFVGVRQTEPTSIAIAEFMIPDDHVGVFGLTVRMNETHRYDLRVTRVEGRLAVQRSCCIGNVTEIDMPVVREYDGSVIQLSIRATAFAYLFTASTDRSTVDLGMAEARYLSSEVAGGFTGVYFGLFAQGGPVTTGTSFEIRSQAA